MNAFLFNHKTKPLTLLLLTIREPLLLDYSSRAGLDWYYSRADTKRRADTIRAYTVFSRNASISNKNHVSKVFKYDEGFKRRYYLLSFLFRKVCLRKMSRMQNCKIYCKIAMPSES